MTAMAVPTAPDPCVELRVIAPRGLVDAARHQVGPGVSTAEVIRRALAHLAGVEVSDFPTRKRGRPRKVAA